MLAFSYGMLAFKDAAAFGRLQAVAAGAGLSRTAAEEDRDDDRFQAATAPVIAGKNMVGCGTSFSSRFA